MNNQQNETLVASVLAPDPDFMQGYKYGRRAAMNMPKKLEMFKPDDNHSELWIDGYKFGFADGLRSGASKNPKRFS